MVETGGSQFPPIGMMTAYPLAPGLFASVIQWQNVSFPSWLRGFDSRHSLGDAGLRRRPFLICALRSLSGDSIRAACITLRADGGMADALVSGISDPEGS